MLPIRAHARSLARLLNRSLDCSIARSLNCSTARALAHMLLARSIARKTSIYACARKCVCKQILCKCVCMPARTCVHMCTFFSMPYVCSSNRQTRDSGIIQRKCVRLPMWSSRDAKNDSGIIKRCRISGSHRRSFSRRAPRFMPQDDEVELKPLHLWCDDSESGTRQTMPCTEEPFKMPKIRQVSGPCWRSQLGDIREQ